MSKIVREKEHYEESMKLLKWLQDQNYTIMDIKVMLMTVGDFIEKEQDKMIMSQIDCLINKGTPYFKVEKTNEEE